MQNCHACFQACGCYSLKIMHDSKQKFSHTAKWSLFSYYPVTNSKFFVPFHSVCISRCPFVCVISHAYSTSLRSMKQYGTLLCVHHRSSTWAQQPQSTGIRPCTTADQQRCSVAVLSLLKVLLAYLAIFGLLSSLSAGCLLSNYGWTAVEQMEQSRTTPFL